MAEVGWVTGSARGVGRERVEAAWQAGETVIAMARDPHRPEDRPTPFAATAPDAKPAGYYGSTGLFEPKEPPGDAQIARPAHGETVAARHWKISEALTNTRCSGATLEHAS